VLAATKDYAHKKARGVVRIDLLTGENHTLALSTESTPVFALYNSSLGYVLITTKEQQVQITTLNLLDWAVLSQVTLPAPFVSCDSAAVVSANSLFVGVTTGSLDVLTAQIPLSASALPVLSGMSIGANGSNGPLTISENYFFLVGDDVRTLDRFTFST